MTTKFIANSKIHAGVILNPGDLAIFSKSQQGAKVTVITYPAADYSTKLD
jgi:hypothetical protein